VLHLQLSVCAVLGLPAPCAVGEENRDGAAGTLVSFSKRASDVQRWSRRAGLRAFQKVQAEVLSDCVGSKWCGPLPGNDKRKNRRRDAALSLAQYPENSWARPDCSRPQLRHPHHTLCIFNNLRDLIRPSAFLTDGRGCRTMAFFLFLPWIQLLT
jgi:hypothetical protein